MSYITTDNLTNIMAEMTDYCNAACPMCNRFDWGLNLIKGVNAHHTTLEFVKQRIGDEIISRLKDILEGEFFKDISEGINGGEKRLQGCYHACGVK